MTVVNPKSISGINSITMASGSDDLLTIHSNNTTERVRVNNSGDVIIGSGVTLSPDGDIFATGITTVSGNVKVGTGITLSPDGDVFVSGASTFSGAVTIDDGLNVGGALSIPDMMHHGGDTDTQIRFPAADTISFETAGSERARIDSNGYAGIGANDPHLYYSKTLVVNATTEGDGGGITIRSGGTTHTNYLMFADSNSGAARYDGYIGYNHNTQKLVLGAGQNPRAELDSNGHIAINDGNLVIATNGHGIDFSANTSDASGMAAELLDDYEEGTFTPNIQGTGANNSKTYSYQLGKYTKIGNIVHCEFRISWSSYGGNDSGSAIVNGLPFTIDNNIQTGAIIGSLATNQCNYPGSNTVVTAGWEAANGTTYVYPLVTYDNSGWDNPAASSFWGGTANVRGSVTYRVN